MQMQFSSPILYLDRKIASRLCRGSQERGDVGTGLVFQGLDALKSERDQ